MRSLTFFLILFLVWSCSLSDSEIEIDSFQESQNLDFQSKTNSELIFQLSESIKDYSTPESVPLEKQDLILNLSKELNNRIESSGVESFVSSLKSSKYECEKNNIQNFRVDALPCTDTWELEMILAASAYTACMLQAGNTWGGIAFCTSIYVLATIQIENNFTDCINLY